ncbi:MAG TPA: preprotein translocase subunit YajC, partial [Rhodothermales bacterium]|nr:preprotein translocase subunit YajC [Rhodothermales bacterium]
MSFLPLVLIMLVFYFLILRPQQKKEKERKEQINALQKGDEVLTVGGIFGKVTEVAESHVMVQ